MNADVVDLDSITTGITLVKWFKGEARRIYSMLGETDDARDQRRLVEWIECKGGSVTARKIQLGHRQYQTADEADSVLTELAKAGYGKWEPMPPS